ncbi:metal dependent phosphohydrolase [Ferroglobus placidus DSM 10642]|uniref:Metal dependent phosphohydrolase n=1 Tax=Ferroglobus placidus (strain DSM 10642 / AEDII12DO) TaxID=589924 RepID=D3S003_FERPA|nr:metal-dependent phosphohydrolase [Ferroglobus placidus]ADC66066.1 metal dependent phosphohydrolase [Ferroglobus placidus DSM 10642]
MSICKHEDSKKRDWLPSRNHLIKLHPHCKHCGVVRNSSADVGKGIGYFANSLSRLSEFLGRKGHKVSQAQIRMVILEFERKGLADKYSVPFSVQRWEFAKIVKKYICISEEIVLNFL